MTGVQTCALPISSFVALQFLHLYTCVPSSSQVAGIVPSGVSSHACSVIGSSSVSFSVQPVTVQERSFEPASVQVASFVVFHSPHTCGGWGGCSPSPSANAVGSRENTITIAMNSDSNLRFVVFMFIPSFLTSTEPLSAGWTARLSALGYFYYKRIAVLCKIFVSNLYPFCIIP